MGPLCVLSALRQASHCNRTITCTLSVESCKMQGGSQGWWVGFLIKYVNVVWAVTARMPGLDNLDTWECRPAS